MSKAPSFVDQAVAFLSSVKLALVLIPALALAAVGGTIIPQNLDPHQYIDAYGPQFYAFLSYLDMFDMYGSWWFTLLLGLLMVNLIFCSAKRFPMALRLARPADPARISLDFLAKQPFNTTILIAGDARSNLQEAKSLFEKHFQRPVETTKPWGALLSGDKGGFSRFGVYLVHSSLLFIMAGGVVGSWAGFSAFVNINEGQAVHQVMGRKPAGMIDLGFSIRLDKFVVNYYDTGAPSEYRSEVSIIENGTVVQEARIRVNHPLTYQGVTFYQSSFGQSLSGPLTLLVTRRSDQKTFEIQAGQGRLTPLPGEAASIGVLDFSEDLMNAGPAARILIRPDQGEGVTDWAFKNRPQFQKSSPSPYDVLLKDYKLTYSTGLQTNSDPGVALIWLGCGLMLAGFIAAFYFSHQKLYLALAEERDFTKLILAGSAHRNQGAFKLKFDNLAAGADVFRRVERRKK
ncbi:MAG: cytochrome c biogenesis protein ResB [Pseudomonadota bacterium]